jgi:adenylosuccinate synthase
MNSKCVIVMLSGAIGTGKTSVASTLTSGEFSSVHVKTSEVLKSLADPSATRQDLFSIGSNLDSSDKNWVVRAVDSHWARSAAQSVVVDSVRDISQVISVRDAFSRVIHVNLTCNPDVTARRVSQRARDLDMAVDAQSAIRADSAVADSMNRICDVSIDTSRMTPGDVAAIIESHVSRILGRRRGSVDVLVGGQFGSEGKGFVMQHIAHEYSVLCRVGGPNAGHSVTDPRDGSKVSYYHLPSGIMHSPNAEILIGPGAVINPEVLLKEIHVAESRGIQVWNRMTIDRNAVVISADDIASEQSIVGSIGSTGQGVGAATLAKISRRGTARLAKDTPGVFNNRVGDTREILDRRISSGARIMMEGTQGTGLSLHHGFYPYVTSRDTTASGTIGEMGIPPRDVNRVFLVCRTNPIRVQSPDGGTSGPMGVELTWDDVAVRSGVAADSLRVSEKTTTTKRLRRVAEFDFSWLRRSCSLNRPTDVALTFVDYIDRANSGVGRFDQLTEETHKFIEHIESVAGAPVSLISTGFARGAFIDRRRSR